MPGRIQQRKWLERIGEQLEQEIVVDRAALDEEPFVERWRLQRLNRIFDGELEAVLGDINEEMWKNGSVIDGTASRRDIVAKLWNLCHVLRDDGITYHEYVTELTFLLFLKMLKETEHEERLPKAIAGTIWPSAKGSTSSTTTGSCCSISATRRPRMRWSVPSSPTPRRRCASRRISRR